jgi:hypothetical protein
VPRRWLIPGLVALLLVGQAPVTLARFTDAGTSTGSLASGTIQPPTTLAASGGATITLTWGATPTTAAAGYHLYRATSSGGTYTLVQTITPRTTVTIADSPGSAGTFWYRLRAYVQNWESVDSNTVSAFAGTTAYAACVSNAADITGAGDNNGYEGSIANACNDNSVFATDTSSGTSTTASCGSGATPDTTKDRHRFYGFVTGLPASVTSINGIRVRADLALNNTTGTTNLCAQLSWDGGTTWTSIQSQAITTAAETTYTFGGTANLWGRTWTLAQLNTTNFRVRIIDASTLATKVFRLDYVALSVTYTP